MDERCPLSLLLVILSLFVLQAPFLVNAAPTRWWNFRCAPWRKASPYEISSPESTPLRVLGMPQGRTSMMLEAPPSTSETKSPKRSSPKHRGPKTIIVPKREVYDYNTKYKFIIKALESPYQEEQLLPILCFLMKRQDELEAEIARVMPIPKSFELNGKDKLGKAIVQAVLREYRAARQYFDVEKIDPEIQDVLYSNLKTKMRFRVDGNKFTLIWTTQPLDPLEYYYEIKLYHNMIITGGSKLVNVLKAMDAVIENLLVNRSDGWESKNQLDGKEELPNIYDTMIMVRNIRDTVDALFDPNETHYSYGDFFQLGLVANVWACLVQSNDSIKYQDKGELLQKVSDQAMVAGKIMNWMVKPSM